MKPLNTNIGYFTKDIHGLFYRDVKAFDEGTIWQDPLLAAYFKNARIDTRTENINYGKEISSKLLALIVLAIFSPIMLAIAIGIKMMSPGKIFYRQVRVGLNGKLFNVYKFRSMVENAESSTGHTLSWDGDPRVTPFGNFLRKSHLDELPQLINVLIGDMYFIGPRPERPEFTQEYDQTIPDYSKRHEVKPGITGLAQIACVYNATAEDKLKFDLMYIAFRDSITLNFLIAWHTALKMIFMRTTANVLLRDNAY